MKPFIQWTFVEKHLFCGSAGLSTDGYREVHTIGIGCEEGPFTAKGNPVLEASKKWPLRVVLKAVRWEDKVDLT